MIREEIQKLNEGPDSDLYRTFTKIRKDIYNVIKKYEKKADMNVGFYTFMSELEDMVSRMGYKGSWKT